MTQEEHEALMKKVTDELTTQITTLTSSNLELTKTLEEIKSQHTQLTSSYTKALAQIKTHENTIASLHHDIKTRSQPTTPKKSLKETLKELL